MNISIEGPHPGKSADCEPILRSLPGWFGIEAAIAQYLAEIDCLPTFLARISDQVAGFLSLKVHNSYSAEIYVMGIDPSFHHKGMGRALVDAAQFWLRAQGVEYLQVKTLGPSNIDQNYARTRAFYAAVGFRPMEEFKQIWDEQNPCLILIKRL